MVLSSGDPTRRARLLETLGAGGVAILLCDTIYGLVGRAPETESRIRRIKGRGETNPFLMIVGTVAQAAALSSAPLEKSVLALWPAPLTLVLPSATGTVAVRLPNDPFLAELVSALGSPIYSTSVNRSGTPPMWQISEIIREFEDEVDLVIDQGDIPAGKPSTILDVSSRPYRILRQGDFQVPHGLLSG